MQSLFEKNDGTCKREGDYLIPNLSVPDTKEYNIGKYGMGVIKSYRQNDEF